jgi:hypothetical protein
MVAQSLELDGGILARISPTSSFLLFRCNLCAANESYSVRTSHLEASRGKRIDESPKHVRLILNDMNESSGIRARGEEDDERPANLDRWG